MVQDHCRSTIRVWNWDEGRSPKGNPILGLTKGNEFLQKRSYWRWSGRPTQLCPVTSDTQRERNNPVVVLFRWSLTVACACSLIVLCLLLSPCFSVIFRYFSYLDKLLGTLTRVVKVDHTTLGLLETAIRQRVVPQSYWHLNNLIYGMIATPMRAIRVNPGLKL